MDSIEQWKERLARKASVFVLGEDCQTNGAIQSWFGRVTHGEPGEVWPIADGRPMWPLLQMVVGDLPYRPVVIDDLALIRVFVNGVSTAIGESNCASFYEPDGVVGPRFLVRVSSAVDGLVELAEPQHGSVIDAAPGRWEAVEVDYPSFEDLPLEMPEAYQELDWEPREETKVGGWPRLLQSEICWAPYNKHPHNPEYVFQIDSDYGRNWMWGDTGTAYFGRGAGEHRDKWAMEWQCC